MHGAGEVARASPASYAVNRVAGSGHWIIPNMDLCACLSGAEAAGGAEGLQGHSLPSRSPLFPKRALDHGASASKKDWWYSKSQKYNSLGITLDFFLYEL